MIRKAQGYVNNVVVNHKIIFRGTYLDDFFFFIYFLNEEKFTLVIWGMIKKKTL